MELPFIQAVLERRTKRLIEATDRLRSQQEEAGKQLWTLLSKTISKPPWQPPSPTTLTNEQKLTEQP